VIPFTDEFLVAWTASIETKPSPSTKPLGDDQECHVDRKKALDMPWKSPETDILAALKRTLTDMDGWPVAFPVNVIRAVLTPLSRLDQSLILKNTLSSGLVGEMDPDEGEASTQEALLETSKSKELGPPAPTSTKRFGKTEKDSRFTVGGGQLYPCAHCDGLSPGLKNQLICFIKGTTQNTYQAPRVPSGAIRMNPARACLRFWTRLTADMLSDGLISDNGDNIARTYEFVIGCCQ